MRGLYRREPTIAEVEGWVEFMQLFLKDVSSDGEYVYLDGFVLPTDSGYTVIKGWHSIHTWEQPPQVGALRDPEIVTNLIGNRDYWLSTKPNEDDSE